MNAITAIPPVTTLADRLFATLSEEIVCGTITAGSKISEPDLAKRLQVSRASLREAIGRLERCGLVTRRANIGARVVTLSHDQLRQLYQLREALEGMAARLAAQHIGAESLAALQQLLERHRQQVEQSGGERYFQQQGDVDFHYRIARASNNPHLIALLDNQLYHLLRMYRCQFGMSGRRALPALHEHQAIVAAIAAGDGEAAEWLMRSHIRTSRDAALATPLGPTEPSDPNLKELQP